MALLWVFGAVVVCFYQVTSETVSFIKSPMSQTTVTGRSTGLHCEVVGFPVPEVQWWYVEGEEPEETIIQLFDGARKDRVRIQTTYNTYAASTIRILNVTRNDSGMYECRASNDPERNALRKMPKVKWIRSQANIVVFERPYILTEPKEANITTEVLSCNLTEAPSPIKSHHWTRNGKVIEETRRTSIVAFTEYKVEKTDTKFGGEFSCVFVAATEFRKSINLSVFPRVVAPKHNEHVTENDKAVLICESNTYPHIDDWQWYFTDDSMNKKEITENEKYNIKTLRNKTTLYIHNPASNTDSGTYTCQGSNQIGENFDVITLRVRSRLAALWPFLGIVVEVIILVTIIFIFEKRRKHEDLGDDDNVGSAPLKSESAANYKDKNVRQRNCN
ncbi:basigin-like isoform X1 [Brienomyrus brachyistius]|uniref:basigin-like isoform X1 n=1 Tax=Brienomyrus brachyistius TaxID=42636 RepID=UPI0020B375A7|nr:basigin-like isoform X1 [Brienomyrus brachyistius]